MTEERTDICHRLRLARERRDISLRQIADATKLSVRVLDALERGDIKVLPGGIYRRAIVRAYAEHVGLDSQATLNSFLAQHPDPHAPPPSVEAVAAPRRRTVSWQAQLQVLGALLPLLAGLAYFTLVSSVDSDARYRDVPMPSRSSDVWRPEIVPAGGFLEAPPPAARPVALMLTVSSRCELRIVIDGREVVAREVEPGEQLRWDLMDEVELSGSNAGAVHFSINGQAGRLLGAPGEPLQVRIGRDDYERWLD